MSDTELEFNSKPLNQIIKAMTEKGFVAKIGILGQKNARNSDGNNGSNSNATIGAAHEFGSAKLPQRSFLRMPITEMLPKELEAAGLFDEDMLKEVVKNADMRPYVEKIAIAAVAVVMDAFDTNGFGKWAPLSDEYKKWKENYAQKGNVSAVQTLVLTQQLRDSIAYRIEKKS